MKSIIRVIAGLMLTGSIIHAEPVLIISSINNKANEPVRITIAGQSLVLAQDAAITKPFNVDLQAKRSSTVGDALGKNEAWELKQAIEIAQAPVFKAELATIRTLIDQMKAKKKESKALTAALKKMRTKRGDLIEDLAELNQSPQTDEAQEIIEDEEGIELERTVQTPAPNAQKTHLEEQIRMLDQEIKQDERALRDAKNDVTEISDKLAKKRVALEEKQKTSKEYRPLFELTFETTKQEAYGTAFASAIATLKGVDSKEIVSLKEPNLPLSNYTVDYIFELSLTLAQDGQQIKPQLSLAKQIKTGATPLPGREVKSPVLDETEEEESEEAQDISEEPEE